MGNDGGEILQRQYKYMHRLEDEEEKQNIILLKGWED